MTRHGDSTHPVNCQLQNKKGGKIQNSKNLSSLRSHELTKLKIFLLLKTNHFCLFFSVLGIRISLFNSLSGAFYPKNNRTPPFSSLSSISFYWITWWQSHHWHFSNSFSSTKSGKKRETSKINFERSVSKVFFSLYSFQLSLYPYLKPWSASTLKTWCSG